MGKIVIGGAALAAILALWQFGPRFGWGPGGGGGQGGGSAPANVSSTQQTPHRPLRVTIDGNRYIVNGLQVDLATVRRMAAQVPPGDGPAVEVIRQRSSRAKAEQDLKTVMDQEHVSSSWTQPDL